MTLLAPWFLAGLAAAAIPVVIHLIHRRQSRVIPLPTLRFLRQIPARTIRKRRLEEYVLMAARILLLALLALAGARPVLSEARAAGGSTAVAIVLDDSYSMEHRVSGIPRFREGVEAVVAVLEGLEEGDRAALIPASAPAAAALSADLPALVRRAAAARTSPLAPDLAAGVRAGLALLRETREPNRELIVVTDLQRRALAPLLEGVREGPGDETIRVKVLDVGADAPANAGILEVSAGSGAVVAGETVPVVATLRNASGSPRAVRVSLVLGDERVAEANASLAAGETKTVTLAAKPDVPGAEGGRVVLDGDDLPADDVRHFTLPVAGRIPVLLVNGDPSPIAFQDEAFFLRAALSPEDLGAKGVASPVALKTIPPDALGAEDLATYRVVILANVPPLPPRAANAVRAFVLGGGGLLVFTGSRVKADDANRDLGTDPAQGLLPAVLAPPTQVGDDPESELRVEEFDRDHPLFAGLTEEAMKDFGRIRVRRAMGADAKAAGGRVVAALSRGTPLIVEKRPGRGRVLLVNASADTDWGILPVRPIFLPLVHRAVRLLAGAAEGDEQHLLGARIAIPPPPPDAPALEVTSPAGDVARPSETDGKGNLVYGPLLDPGVYRVKGSGRGDFLFAANPDPAEGDLARAAPEAVVAAFGPDRTTVIRGGNGLRTELSRARHGRPIAGWLLGAALLLLLFEAWFANRIARARAAAPEEGETP